MGRGRKPVPTHLKILRGNPGKRPLPEGEPQPGRVLPTCPKHLDAEAKREWKRIARELYVLGLLSRLDRAALAAYCQVWSRWVRAEEALAKTGELTMAGDTIAINPYLHVANRALREMHSFLSEFGMTPAARTRIKAQPAAGEDALAAFLGAAAIAQ